MKHKRLFCVPALDGAGPLHSFVAIGLPMGLPGILSALLLGGIEA